MLLKRSQVQAYQLAALTSYFSTKERGESSKLKLMKALDTSQGKRPRLRDFRLGRPSYTPLTQEIGPK